MRQKGIKAIVDIRGSKDGDLIPFKLGGKQYYFRKLGTLIELYTVDRKKGKK